jgi:hypothetical protein
MVHRIWIALAATIIALAAAEAASAGFMGGGGYRCFDDGTFFSFMCRSY